MKCAIEMIMIKNEAEKNYELEQLRLDEECRKAHLETIIKTIAYCEEVIGPSLEKKAMNREIPCFTLAGCIRKNRVGDKLFSPLTGGSRIYANGDFSYDIKYSETYDVETLKNYLEQYCYKVSFSDYYFKTYGIGRRCGDRLEVTVKPECVKV